MNVPSGAAVDFTTRSIASLFADAVAASPDAVAIVEGDKRVTFAALAAHAHRVAARIGAATPAGAAVAVIVPRGADGLAAILGCVIAARIAIVLDAAQPVDRLADILADARPAATIGANAAIVAALAPSVVHLPLLAERADADANAGVPECAPLGPDAPAFVIYTSGSTGRPKGIVAGQRAVLARARHLIDPVGLHADDCLLAASHPGTMSGLAFAVAALVCGTRQCAFDLMAAGAGAMRALIAREGVSVLIIAPPLLRSLLAVGDLAPALANLRVVRCGADVFPRADLAALRAVLPARCQVEATYASSEGMLMAQWRIPVDFDDGAARLPSGYLQAEHEYALLDAAGVLVPAVPGQSGELVLCSQYIALGEWQDGRLVGGRLVADPARPEHLVLHTGDIVSIDADGLLRVAGRADRQIKINGVRIEPAEIEMAMRAVAGVADAVLLATRAGEHWDLHGVIVAGEEAGTGAAATQLAIAVRAHVAASLPAAMRPRRISVVARIPRLAIGKVDQLALTSLLVRSAKIVSSVESLPPVAPAPDGAPAPPASDAVRQAVAHAWARTLDRQSLTDDLAFDEAGGDSLRFLIFVYHMEELLGATLPLDLFELSMPPSAVTAAVARHLSGSAAAGGELPVLFLLPGIGGDEPRLMRFREACAETLRIVPVDYGTWRDWISLDFKLDPLLTRIAADIQARAPTGALMLAGYSLGGFMAYAVAALLAEAGRDIRVVGLLDAANIGVIPKLIQDRHYDREEERSQLAVGFRTGNFRNMLARALVRRLSGPRMMWLLPLATRVSQIRLGSDFIYYLRGHLRISLLTKFTTTPRGNFAPCPAMAGVPLLLLRSELRVDDSDDLGWAGYGRSVAVVPVPGDHFNMFDPPHVGVLAERFVVAMRPYISA